MQETISVSRPAIPPRSARRLNPIGLLRGLLGRRASIVGAVILVPMILLAVAQPVLPITNATETDPLNRRRPPSFSHPFGTDSLGRDILSRIIAGARVSLLVAFSASGIALVVGVLVGTLSGVGGKVVDGFVMAVVDVLLSFPSLLLAIGFVAVFGAGIAQVILAIALADIPRAIRLQRALALGIAPRGFMDAARMVSARTPWLIGRHVVPNTIAPMLVVASIYAANAILVEASLSFLGLGIVPPQPSWGNMIAEGRPYLQSAWWLSVFPGIAIILAAIGLNLFADSARAGLDTRMKN